jgi:hypothetical protein
MKLFSFILLAMALYSCEPENKQNDCQQAICTADFRSVAIKVVDKNHKIVRLDRHTTFRKRDNQLIYTEDYLLSPQDTFFVYQFGIYPIFTDSHKNFTTFNGEEFIFEGVKNNQVIVRESFVIGKDCCHIARISGKDSVVVE